jgi:hypothetical protein
VKAQGESSAFRTRAGLPRGNKILCCATPPDQGRIAKRPRQPFDLRTIGARVRLDMLCSTGKNAAYFTLGIGFHDPRSVSVPGPSSLCVSWDSHVRRLCCAYFLQEWAQPRCFHFRRWNLRRLTWGSCARGPRSVVIGIVSFPVRGLVSFRRGWVWLGRVAFRWRVSRHSHLGPAHTLGRSPTRGQCLTARPTATGEKRRTSVHHLPRPRVAANVRHR